MTANKVYWAVHDWNYNDSLFYKLNGRFHWKQEFDTVLNLLVLALYQSEQL